MSVVEEMLEADAERVQVDVITLSECVDACFECVGACTACADACLGEDQVKDLTRCIRLNLDCADICEATGRVLTRQAYPDWGLLRCQLEACARACDVSGAECRRHARTHQHCEICAESCSRCEEECRHLLQALPASA